MEEEGAFDGPPGHRRNPRWEPIATPTRRTAVSRDIGFCPLRDKRGRISSSPTDPPKTTGKQAENDLVGPTILRPPMSVSAKPSRAARILGVSDPHRQIRSGTQTTSAPVIDPL
jgi:hypothetical protein